MWLDYIILYYFTEEPDVEPIPEYTATEEKWDETHWRVVEIDNRRYRMDEMIVTPYKRVLSHAGYYGTEKKLAVVMFFATFLPDRNRPDYKYIMDNLFL